jgi:hypothetical protein
MKDFELRLFKYVVFLIPYYKSCTPSILFLMRFFSSKQHQKENEGSTHEASKLKRK